MQHETRIDLHTLPRVEDGWTFLYAEHVRIDRDQNAIMLRDQHSRTPVPVAALSVLMCGPGTSVTHAAMTVMADNGCSVLWVGEGGVRLYASGSGETRRSANLLHQAQVWADEKKRMEVVYRMYRMRFPRGVPDHLSLQQLRGMEGVRVREAYANASKLTCVPWTGRSYKQDDWRNADPVNRALSTANACLYGLCHSAIVATGFSPGLGFIHTGKVLSFVYDIADLYKVDVTIPLAFAVAQEGPRDLERRTRLLCRDVFFRRRLITRVVPDIQRALGMTPDKADLLVHGHGQGETGGLWDPGGVLSGGKNYGDVPLERPSGDPGESPEEEP